MILKEILEKIEKFAPLNIAAEGDNIGLMFGNKNKQINKVLVALDVDKGVIEEAKSVGADLIITHHPLMFEPLYKINEDTYAGACLVLLAEYGIALYSAHTNLDSAVGGINDKFAEKLGMKDLSPLEVTYTDENGVCYGIGRKGVLEKETTLKDFAQLVVERFGIESTVFVGDETAPVKTVCVCSGSGGSFIDDGIDTDVYVTGDIKYSGARKATEKGINIVVAGHYETEIVCMEIFADVLKDLPIEIVFSRANKNVFKYIAK